MHISAGMVLIRESPDSPFSGPENCQKKTAKTSNFLLTGLDLMFIFACG